METVDAVSRRSFARGVCMASLYIAAFVGGVRSALAEPQPRGEAESAALAVVQQEYDAAEARLQDIGRQLESTQFEVSSTEHQLEQLQVDIADTRAGIAQTTSDLEAAQSALAAFLQISYKSGATNILDVLLSSSDFNDFVTRSYYVEAVQDSQVETINEIKELKILLEHQEAILSDQESEQAALLAQLQAQEDALSQQKIEADQVVAGLSVEVQQLFAAQQTELAAAAEAYNLAASAAAGGEAIGVYTPGISQGSVVENAYACLGIAYIWGGDDENFAVEGGYDCSGFVQHCYALEGYIIGRTTWDQIDQIKALGNWRESVDELQPGDLVFPHDGHVGIYIGNYQMIDAPFPGMFIRIDPIEEFIGGGSPV